MFVFSEGSWTMFGSWGYLRGILELFWASSGHLGRVASSGLVGASFGYRWGFSSAYWRSRGFCRGGGLEMSIRFPSLGAFWGLPGGLRGASEDHRRLLGAVFGDS